MSTTNYKVEYELRRYGDTIEVPDAASNLSVQPVGQSGLVRVTYLKPIDEVPIADDQDESPDELTYVN